MRTALYRHFDAAGSLLYVGITDGLAVRDRQHRDASPWHGEVAKTEAQWFDSREDAVSAEAQAITMELPAHNALWSCQNARQAEVKRVLAAIGRKNLQDRLGVTHHSIRVAVNEGSFPANWYLVVSAMCASVGADCPMGAFNWRQPSKAEAA